MQAISLNNKRRHYAKSSSFVMALLFTVLCGAVALTLGYFINYFAKGHFVHGTQSVLDSEIRYVGMLDDLPVTKTEGARIYVPLDQQGQLPPDFPKPSMRLVEGLLVFEMQESGEHYAARIHTRDDGRKILVGTNITELSHDFQFMQWIGITSIIFVMFVVFISYVISIFVVSGTNKIAGTAYDIITTGDLSRRVEMNSRWDDLGNVAGLLNALFDRIEELMQGVRQVSDNIAHDLRTPLTRMRSHIESLQKQEPKNAAYDELLAEADHILATFNALLRISRIETEKQRSQFAALCLDEVLRDVADFYEPLAEERGLTLSLEAAAANLHGDRDLLFQAFANILDNAVKFTDDNGIISIRSSLRDGRIVTEVENTSTGLDTGDMKKIFERFYRADKSRRAAGYGLGLSLVSAVIDLHRGLVSAENTQDGFKIITIL